MDLGVIYNAFISSFCKVEFLCYAGSPNWLGWGLLGGAIIFLVILFNSLPPFMPK